MLGYFAGRRTSSAVRTKSLQGKKVVITGASSGIGKVLAIELAKYGADMVLVARREPLLNEVVAKVEARGGVAKAIACDLADRQETENLIDEVLREHGRVDILVNNAGYSIRREVVASLDRYRDIERTMGINYFSPMRLIYGFLPSMLDNGCGHIMNSVSGVVIYPIPRFSAYGASKSALATYSNMLGVELKRSGIDVTNLFLPLVATPMTDSTDVYSKKRSKLMPAEKAVESMIDAMVRKPSKVTFNLWIGEILNTMLPDFNRWYLNKIFVSYSTKTKAEPDSSVFSRVIRKFWVLPPL